MCQHPLTLVRYCFVLGIALACAGAFAASVVLDPSGPPEAQVTLISESHGEIVLDFRLSTVDVDTESVGGQEWRALTAPGMRHTERTGWPDVPQLSAWLQGVAADAVISIFESDTLHRNWGPPRPVPEPVDRNEPLNLHYFPDAAFYTSSQIYPVAPATITLHGDLGRAPLSLISFSPFQYDARNSEWIVTTHLRVRITSARGGSLDQLVGRSRSTRDILERLALNPGPVQPDSSSSPRLLLITQPQFLPALQPLIDWKARSGIPVLTAIYSQVASNAATLRAYIRHLCDSLSTSSPEYVLIVGDVNIIPPFFGLNNSLTDHPYSLLSDTDYLPDLSVGRIPCQTAEDCELWVSRLLAYERDATLPQNFTGSVISSSAGVDPQHGIYVGNLFQNAGMTTVNRMQEPQTATLANVLNSLNAGRQWVFYIGHGTAEEWTSIEPAFSRGVLNQVSGNAAPIVVSVACATADLDYPGESFAEQWLGLPSLRGPLAYFGATERTPFYYSDTLGIGALRAVFLQHCERLGTAADLGRLATAQCFPQPPGGLTEETIQQFTLLGDPSMRVFTAPPETLTVNAPQTIPLQSQALTATVLRGSAPAGGADVCVSSDSLRVYVVRRSDSLGQVTLPLRLRSIGELRLTVTAANAVPVLRTITVVPDTASYLGLAQISILDNSGDHDGQADRGESSDLRFSLFNAGALPTASGVIRVSTTDPRVVIQPLFLSLPQIAPRDTVWLSRTLPVTVSDSANDLDVAMLRVAADFSQGDSTVFLHPLVLHAAQFVALESSLREDSGDGDGNPEAGERLALRLPFHNIGTDRAASPACSLWTSAPGIHILGTQVSSSLIMPGDTLTVTTLLLPASTVPRGFEFDFGYELSGAHFPPLTGVGTEHIGQVPVFLYAVDPTPAPLNGVADALTCLGVEHERSTTLPQDLSQYASIWIFCGVFPNEVSLSQSDASRLATYLDNGGNCYWEGGDVWVFDAATPLHPYFHIQGVQDGSSDAGPVAGETGTAFSAYRFEYAGENSFIDRLAPIDGAITLLRNVRPGAVYPLCIGYHGANYRTIGSSIELGALSDTTLPSTRVNLFRDMLSWFGIESRADTSAPAVRVNIAARIARANRPLPIFADIQDASGIQSAALRYHIGDGIIQNPPMQLARGSYVGYLPATPAGAVISYSIRAADDSPSHNTVTTPEYSIQIGSENNTPFCENFATTQRTELAPRILTTDGCSWSLTTYPQTTPVLELHAQNGSAISYETDVFDCSGLQKFQLSFWHFLRETAEQTRVLAQVTGSTNGGATFPHSVWEYSQQGGGVLEEGTVQTSNLDWMADQSQVALRFEFFGSSYWRLGSIEVTGAPAPQTAPVRDLVIALAPSGIELTWGSVPGAKRYIVYASASSHFTDDYREIARVSDTTFTEWDDTAPSRYYMVRALMQDETSPSTKRTARPPATTTPALRSADLKWNQKLRAGR